MMASRKPQDTINHVTPIKNAQKQSESTSPWLRSTGLDDKHQAFPERTLATICTRTSVPGGVDKSCTPWAFSVVQQVGCCLSPPQSETRSEMTINMEYKYLPNHCEHKKAHSNQAHNIFDLNIDSQTKNLASQTSRALLLLITFSNFPL